MLGSPPLELRPFRRTERRAAAGGLLVWIAVLSLLLVAAAGASAGRWGTSPSAAGTTATPAPVAAIDVALGRGASTPSPTSSGSLERVATIHVAGQMPLTRPIARPIPTTVDHLRGRSSATIPEASAPIFALSLAGPSEFSGVNVTAKTAGIDSSSGAYVPPDVQIASGPTEEMEMVNLEYEVFDRNGTPLSSGGLSSFFGSGSDFLSDPKVLYDNLSGRWFASILDFGSSGHILLAVSSSMSAEGNWTVYAIPAPSGKFTDQPILGVSSATIGLAGDIFDASTSAYSGSEFWVVNKSAALAGTNPSYVSFGPSGASYQIHAVQSLSPTGDQYFVMNSYAGPTSAIEVFRTTGVPPASVSLFETNLTIGSVALPPSAPQPTTSSTINPGDARVQAAVWQSGSLTLTFNDGCQSANDTAVRGCARLVGINTTTWSVTEDVDVTLPGAGLYYPSIALAPDGRLTVVLGASSKSLYPSVLATGWAPADPPSTLEPAKFVANGTAPLSCGGDCRFGDYFGAAEAPDGQGAWVAGEDIVSSSVAWSTALGLVSVRGAPSVDLSANPSSLEVGQRSNLTIGVLNAPCTAGSGYRCSVDLPLPTGSFQATCDLEPTSHVVGLLFTAPGNYTIGQGGTLEIFATSNCTSASLVAEFPIAPLVVPVGSAPSVILAATPAYGADVGQPITFVATVSGGSQPFTLTWTSLPTGCVNGKSVTERCVATAAGIVPVSVTLVDAKNVSARGSLSYRVNPALVVNVSAERTSADVGSVLFLTATPSGGAGSYGYDWAGLPTGCTNDDTPTLGCSPTEEGVYSVSVQVTDAFAIVATSPTLGIAVFGALTVQAIASPATVAVGSPIQLTGVAQGGVPPISYAWSMLPPGCTPANSSAINCDPNAAGSYRVVVTATDAGGGVGSAVVNVTANPKPASGGLGGYFASPGTWIWLAVVALLVLIAAVAIGLTARRRRSGRNGSSARRGPR